MGNRAAGAWLQAKLRVGPADDAYEHEAERVAARVTTAGTGPSAAPPRETRRGGRAASEGGAASGRGTTPEDTLQRRPEPGGGVTTAPALGPSLLGLGPDMPLPARLRARFEPRFGHDFRQVRLHTGPRAADAARGLAARAFTYGHQVAFGAGEYAPDTGQGQRLLAHELAHVVQQQRAPRRIQRFVPRPAIISPRTVAFNTLPDRRQVSDPTGRSHGITIERRGQELFYHLPGGATRQVPRPLDTSARPPAPRPILSVEWASSMPITQTAFSVRFGGQYGGLIAPTFYVNVHGLGQLSTLMDLLARRPGSLEIQPGGLEMERQPGILSQLRPRGRRFRDATRYHMPGVSYSLYAFRNRTLEVAEDGTGTRLWLLPGRLLRDFTVSRAGRVRVTWDEARVGVVTVEIDLASSFFSPTGLGVLGVSAQRPRLLASLRASGITIVERGARFTDVELAAAQQVLQRWRGTSSVAASLRARRVRRIRMIKDVAISGASWNSVTGDLKIPGDVERTPAEQRSAVIHELTHALFQARGLIVPRTGTAPAHVRQRARDLHLLAGGAIDEGPVSAQRPRSPRSVRDWERALSTDPTLNRIWDVLHFRFPISDPEGTSDIRGMDVADESRYLGSPRGDVVGHGFDNVSEFIASFVTSTLQFQPQMIRTIQASGNRRLAGLYQELWTWVNTHLVRLGTTNPYDAVIRRLSQRPARPAPARRPARGTTPAPRPRTTP